MKRITLSGDIGWEITAEGLKSSLDEAAGQPIEVSISSRGGLVGTALEMYNMIRNYPGQKTAIMSGYVMSAASYLAMAFDTVIAEDNAVFMIHNAQGVTVGDHNEMSKMAAILKGLSSLLGSAYAKFTGKKPTEIASLMDAETWFYGQEIANAGFAHDMLTTQDDNGDQQTAMSVARLAFSGIVQKLNDNARMYTNDLSQAAAMADITNGVKPTQKENTIMNLNQLREQHPDLVAALEQELTATMGKKIAEAKQEGAAAERDRIQNVRAQLVPGHEDLIEALAFDGSTTGPEAAVKIIAAEKKIRETALANLKSNAPPVIPPVTMSSTGESEQASLPIEDQAKAKWDKSPDIRAEFRTYNAYLAFCKADAEGRVKILGR